MTSGEEPRAVPDPAPEPVGPDGADGGADGGADLWGTYLGSTAKGLYDAVATTTSA